MDIQEIIQVTTSHIPLEVSWSTQEAYGPYHIPKDGLTVQRALYCVTPRASIVEYAKSHGYDLLISHHPFVVAGIPQLVFHTALDCCDGGLNDMWRDALEVQEARHFDKTLGWYGAIKPLKLSELKEKVEDFCGGFIGEIYQRPGVEDTVSSVVICSGLGGFLTDKAEETGADCYILGELCCPGKDTKFNSVLEIGHTYSEWIGVKLFQKLLPSLEIDCAPMELDYFSQEIYRKNPFV